MRPFCPSASIKSNRAGVMPNRRSNWLSRFRAADSRTWVVRLTRRGRQLFERAYRACVESGDAAVRSDYGLAGGHVEIDAMNARHHFLAYCDDVQTVHRAWPFFHGPDLYLWRAEDYYFHFVDVSARGDIPFVS